MTKLKSTVGVVVVMTLIIMCGFFVGYFSPPQITKHMRLDAGLPYFTFYKEYLTEKRVDYVLSDAKHSYEGHCLEDQPLEQWNKQVYDKIDTVMNPGDCSSAKYLLCEWGHRGTWGFGSIVHHLLYCFSVAMATKRVLKIKIVSMQPNTWEKYFLPLSDACNDFQTDDAPDWSTLNHPQLSTKQAIRVYISPLTTGITGPNQSEYMPYFMFPFIKYDDIMRHHQLPELWVLGQYMHYLFQPSPWMKLYLKNIKTNVGFDSGNPIVGLHIRHGGNKWKEADLLPVDVYMKQVEDFIMTLAPSTQPLDKPSIYLASDTPSIYKEVQNAYPQYNWLYLDQTLNINHLDLIITDLLLLSHTDYFIGTFSSNVGRLVHMLRQSRYGDGSCMSRSVDAAMYWVMCCSTDNWRAASVQLHCDKETISQQVLTRQKCQISARKRGLLKMY